MKILNHSSVAHGIGGATSSSWYWCKGNQQQRTCNYKNKSMMNVFLLSKLGQTRKDVLSLDFWSTKLWCIVSHQVWRVYLLPENEWKRDRRGWEWDVSLLWRSSLTCDRQWCGSNIPDTELNPLEVLHFLPSISVFHMVQTLKLNWDTPSLKTMHVLTV